MAKKIITTTNVIFFLICFANVSFLQAKESKSSLKVHLEKLVKSGSIPSEDLGIWVGETYSAKEVYQHNGNRLFLPASLSKIATATAVLNEMPMDIRLTTELWATGEQSNSVLKGDLILKGGGDPAFVSENMWYLVNAFLREGIKVIKGDLIVDETYFEGPIIDSSRESVRVDRAYDAPVSAMSFNWNSVNVFIRPSSEVGTSAKVFADPENEYIKVINKTKTIVASGKNTIAVSRVSDKDFFGDVIEVTGQIPVDNAEIVFYKNITHPALWSGYNLKAFLSQRGISIKGQVRVGKASTSARKVVEVQSKALENLVSDMQKFSNNFVAEVLTKDLGAQGELSGNMEKGLKRIRTFLSTKVGLKDKEFQIENPSGFSRDNHFSPRALGQILNYEFRQFPTAPEFMSALSIAGRDGTLKKRLKGTKGQYWIRGKTGFLNGVVGLAGYASRGEGDLSTFVFIFNGNSKHEGQARDLFDRLALAIVQ